ncbi:hypothetical protein [Mycobacterium deserti]|uniref:Uncharacterized protein n=1 Tax=Mycobacterium deserti TaxID=2978347 RepID=A0ABT2MJJ4_9MYCO|nr:hypothetical protein [Mycobacterium deserti]MCT7661689.1 hypothetical protein [Mycobacterium deserti]
MTTFSNGIAVPAAVESKIDQLGAAIVGLSVAALSFRFTTPGESLHAARLTGVTLAAR